MSNDDTIRDPHFVIKNKDESEVWKGPFSTHEQATAELNAQLQIHPRNDKGWHVVTDWHPRRIKKDAFDAI